MKHRSAQHKEKAKQVRSVIPYPPGYKGQPLTQEVIFFSDRLVNCAEEYRGIFSILLKQFAVEMGCGDSERSRNYLNAIANGKDTIWFNEYLPAVVFVSIEEQYGDTLKRVLKIMPTLQLAEMMEIVDVESGVNRDNVSASDAQTPAKTFAGVFNF